MSARFDVGCYGDGTFGHQHTRQVCADVINTVMYSNPGKAWGDRKAARALMAELLADMSDDASEEYDACDWLNEYAPQDGASWDWRDGDFGLWPDEDSDGGYHEGPNGGLPDGDCVCDKCNPGGDQ